MILSTSKNAMLKLKTLIYQSFPTMYFDEQVVFRGAFELLIDKNYFSVILASTI